MRGLVENYNRRSDDERFADIRIATHQKSVSDAARATIEKLSWLYSNQMKLEQSKQFNATQENIEKILESYSLSLKKIQPANTGIENQTLYIETTITTN